MQGSQTAFIFIIVSFDMFAFVGNDSNGFRWFLIKKKTSFIHVSNFLFNAPVQFFNDVKCKKFNQEIFVVKTYFLYF
jgi:hypothetical protein